MISTIYGQSLGRVYHYVCFITANIPMISRPNHCDQGKREAELQGLVACALMMLDAFSDQVQRSWLCGNPQQ